MYKIGGPADGVGAVSAFRWLAGWLVESIFFFAVLFHILKIKLQSIFLIYSAGI